MTDLPQPPGDQPPGTPYDPTAATPPGSYPPPGAPTPPPAYPPAGSTPPPSYPPSGDPYNPPPAYGTPPTGGTTYGGGAYGAPGAAPVGYANSDEKTWALIAHFGGIVVGFLAPLIAMLVKGDESPTVRAHAVEALNFQITWAVIILVATTVTCGFGIVIAYPIMIILAVMGGIKANEGTLWRYPAIFRLIK